MRKQILLATVAGFLTTGVALADGHLPTYAEGDAIAEFQVPVKNVKLAAYAVKEAQDARDAANTALLDAQTAEGIAQTAFDNLPDNAPEMNC